MSNETVTSEAVDEVEMDEVMSADTVTDAEFEESEAPAAAVNPMALGIGDLNTMATVLDAAAQRGAIRANEMHVVGQLYTKLHSFLVENGLREAPGTATPQESDAPEETVEETTDD
jgi:hypothetical protein|tara:strand:- start:335 stop:682 length:348 start_codon:yes stop_codon:yes gene_type:complete